MYGSPYILYVELGDRRGRKRAGGRGVSLWLGHSSIQTTLIDLELVQAPMGPGDCAVNIFELIPGGPQPLSYVGDAVSTPGVNQMWHTCCLPSSRKPRHPDD